MTATLMDPQIATAALTAVPVTHPVVRAAMRTPTNRAQLHRAVMSLFPDELPGPAASRRAASSILFRLDQPAGKPARLLVQATVPMRTDLPGPALACRDLTPLLVRLNEGSAVQFRVVLNTVRSSGKRAGRTRTPVTDTSDLADFGMDRLTRAGLSNVTLTSPPSVALQRAKGALATAQYDGFATIDDPDGVREAVLNGIGRAKAYGCGLLSLALAKSP